MKNTNKPKAVLHGEAKIVFRPSIPSEAIKKEVTSPLFIIADSETTGNHHVVVMNEGVEIFECGGKTYANAKQPFDIKCVHADRHSTATLPAGSYEFGVAKEYDPFDARMKKVAD